MTENKLDDESSSFNPVNVIICIGSNFGKRKEIVRNAIEELQHHFEVIKVSSLYETPAIGNNSSHTELPSYINAVISCNVEVDALERLESMLKEMEKKAGRDLEARRLGKVPLDMDIVIFNNNIIRPRDFNQKFFKIGFQQVCQ